MTQVEQLTDAVPVQFQCCEPELCSIDSIGVPMSCSRSLEETHFQQVLRTCRFWAEPLNHSGSVSLVPQNSFYSTKGWSYQAITTPSLGAVFASEVEPSAGQEQSCRDSQQKFPGPRSAACGGFALNQTLRLKGPCFGFGRRHTYPEYGA